MGHGGEREKKLIRSVALLAAGQTVENPPRILQLYLFCSPSLDGRFRCLPQVGGYYDQDHVDMVGFKIIERKLAEINRDKAARAALAEKTRK